MCSGFSVLDVLLAVYCVNVVVILVSIEIENIVQPIKL